jgi:ADP-ribose pyrophosphatase YjhB (NUDIX family)
MTHYRDFTGRPVGKPTRIGPGASAVIFNDQEQVLLEKRSDNSFWGLPGGAVDIGESVEEAVIREIFEETGLTVVVRRLVGVYSDPRHYAIASYPDGNVIQHVTLCFECDVRAGELKMSSESTDLGYFSTDGLPANTLPGHKVRIADALSRGPEAVIR